MDIFERSQAEELSAGQSPSVEQMLSHSHHRKLAYRARDEAVGASEPVEHSKMLRTGTLESIRGLPSVPPSSHGTRNRNDRSAKSRESATFSKEPSGCGEHGTVDFGSGKARALTSVKKRPAFQAVATGHGHTTDHLVLEDDEYIFREIDQSGERKVSNDGYPLGGRRYKCRTFNLPSRGNKLFMLATESAHLLGYRDSSFLFNNNRTLNWIIASQAEKDSLVHQEIIPRSYRSRYILIITARSMFRRFGSRLIEGGRRVRDDYWEEKARKQGLSENDAAGDERPGAAKARELAAVDQANAMSSVSSGETTGPQQQVTGGFFMDASWTPAQQMLQARAQADFNQQLAVQRHSNSRSQQHHYHEQRKLESNTESAESSMPMSAGEANLSWLSQSFNAPRIFLTTRAYKGQAFDQQQEQYQALSGAVDPRLNMSGWGFLDTVTKLAEQAVVEHRTSYDGLTRDAVDVDMLFGDKYHEREDIEEQMDFKELTPPSTPSAESFTTGLATTGTEGGAQPTDSRPRLHGSENDRMLYEAAVPSEIIALAPDRHTEAAALADNSPVETGDHRMQDIYALRGNHDRRVRCFGCGLQLLRYQVPDHLRSADQAACREMYAALIRSLAKQLKTHVNSRSSTPLSSASGTSIEQSEARLRWTRTRSLPPLDSVRERQVTVRAQSESPTYRCCPAQNGATSSDTSRDETRSNGLSSGSSENTREGRKRSVDAGSNDTSGCSEPIVKRRRTFFPENQKPWQCIYHHVMTTLRRFSDCDRPHWPSPSGMYRHMRERHKIFICEKCFTAFPGLEGWKGHTRGGEDPCHDSCEMNRCRRATRASLPRPRPCEHLETKLAQWEAARSVIHDLLSQRLTAETFRPAVSSAQELRENGTPLQEANFLDLDNFDLVSYLQQSNAASDTIGATGDVFPEFSVPEVPMAAVHDLGPLVTQLRQELTAAREGQARAEASMNAVRHSLTRACNELAEMSNLSSMTRTMLQSDAPEVLYSVDRTLNMRSGQVVAPNLTSSDVLGLSQITSNDGIASWLGASLQPQYFQEPQQHGISFSASGQIDPRLPTPESNQQRPVTNGG